MQTEETEKPAYKIYKPSAVGIGAFLGGPLVAAYMISENFMAFGQRRNFWMTWVISIAVILVLLLFYSMLNLDIIIGGLLVVIYSALAISITTRVQAEEIATHSENDGDYHSIFNILSVCVVGQFASILIVISILQLLQGN